MNSKKGQDGVNAAILVAIIAALIVMYILFLPGPERERLLEPDEFERKHKIDSGNEILLDEPVGQLTVGEDLERQKDIPSVSLFETTNAKELAKLNPFVVKNGAFVTQNKQTQFRLDDAANTNNVLLTFNLQKHEGTLQVKLNSQIIFESELDGVNVAPIRLDQHLLATTNTLEFSVSGVGAAFWKTNEYAFNNIKIVGDITDKSKQEGQNVIFLSEDEYINLEEVKLQFVPYCQLGQRVGVLDIDVNNRNVFSGVPVCDDPYRIDVPTGVFNQGQNWIIFKTNRGAYTVEQIRMDLDFDKTVSETFFFEVNESFFEDIRDNRDDVILTMNFIDDDEDKRGALDVNDRFFSFDQDEKQFSLDVTNEIEIGNNFVRILPETELNIIDLIVEVKERD